MAAEYTKEVLSGSTDGKNIKVSATSTPGTVIHTAHASALDEVWIYATNTSSTDKNLTIEWGGITDPDDLLVVAIPPQSGDVLVKAGVVLTNGAVIRAFSNTADVINISGFVNRITG
jgi:hypothetical protein